MNKQIIPKEDLKKLLNLFENTHARVYWKWFTESIKPMKEACIHHNIKTPEWLDDYYKEKK